MRQWSTACPDWEARLLAGRPLVPELPLFQTEADRALQVFKRLRIPDIVGTPTMAEACGEWFFPIVSALFGSFDPAAGASGKRYLQEFFLLIPKGNSKSSNGGAVMLTALLVNRRPRAEFLLIAPTKEIAEIAFRQAVGTIMLDPILEKLFHIQDHKKKITYRKTSATLQIKAADTDVITGSKATGTMIDETHVFAAKPKAADVFVELRGALTKRTDGFLFQTTTQSKTPPSGVFKAELANARAVRDGKLDLPLLPILYELPLRLSKDDGWKERKYWGLVNPNLGKSTSMDFLEREVMKAELEGKPKLALIASQHFNVELGQALATDNWAGAEFWVRAGNAALTLQQILDRSEVITVGIDGGGLDDLLGLTVCGRCRDTRRWLTWTHAWAHPIVLERRKEIAPLLLDFEKQQDLTLVSRPGQDVDAVADIVMKIEALGLLAENGIGVDSVGIGDIVEELTSRGIAFERIIAISQGWKLTAAIKTTERRVAGGEMEHCARPFMTWNVGNAKVEPIGNAVRITKQMAGSAKIDGLMSLFNAVTLMMADPAPVNPKPQLFFV